MEVNEYRNIFLQEKQYWLYVGIRKLTIETINKIFSGKSNLKVLDAGCGTGGLIDELQRNFACYGIDISDEALKFCKVRDLNNIINASVEKIPFANNTFDIIVSIDVLYHLLVADDTAALSELFRVLNENGILILNLAAYEFLRSGHDDVVHTRQRYVRKELEAKVKQAGFTITKLTYRNTVFFPLVCVIRVINKLINNQSESDLKALPGWLNRILINILTIENKILNLINLPFGLSIFCVAQKKKKQEAK